MLLEFGFRNYFSFREGMTMSFRLDSKCPEDISRGKNYTPVICVKGANASGKTQVLKGISFLGNFCVNSFKGDPDGPIPLNPFFQSTEPSEFFAEFISDGIAYRYELTTTDAEVIRETVYRRKNRKVKLIDRVGDEISATGAMQPLQAITVRKNASVISTARQFKLDIPEFESIFKFFRYIISNVGYGGLRERPADIDTVSKYLHENEEVFGFVKKFILEADTGISDIRILEANDKNEGERYFPVFYHKHGKNEHPIFALTESSGTKALYRDLATYHLALAYGGIAVVDEMDINLHPFVLAKIVDLFLDDETNRTGAQLIFSTHNTEILDHLGRYRTYLVNKANNESFAYRLDEIPGDILRNDRPISPAYKERKIGGVPSI